MNVNGKPSQRWGEAQEAERAKWQPVMLISPTRLECRCGALAIFMCLAVDADGDICDGEAYCQPCYERIQDAEED